MNQRLNSARHPFHLRTTFSTTMFTRVPSLNPRRREPYHDRILGHISRDLVRRVNVSVERVDGDELD